MGCNGAKYTGQMFHLAEDGDQRGGAPPQIEVDRAAKLTSSVPVPRMISPAARSHRVVTGHSTLIRTSEDLKADSPTLDRACFTKLDSAVIEVMAGVRNLNHVHIPSSY